MGIFLLGATFGVFVVQGSRRRAHTHERCYAKTCTWTYYHMYEYRLGFDLDVYLQVYDTEREYRWWWCGSMGDSTTVLGLSLSFIPPVFKVSRRFSLFQFQSYTTLLYDTLYM